MTADRDVRALPRLTLDRIEAADALGIGVTTLDEWTRDGFLPSIHRGKIRLYSVRALERWAEEASEYEETRRDEERPAGAVPTPGRSLASGGAGGSRKPRASRPRVSLGLISGHRAGEAR